MERKTLINSSILVILLLILVYFIGCKSKKKAYGSDDACVREALDGYSRPEFRHSIVNVDPQLGPLLTSSADPSARPQSRNNIPIIILPDLVSLEGFFRLLECAFPPFPINDQQVIAYPSALPPWCDDINPTTPGKIMKNGSIPNLAQAIGRLEVRSSNTDPPVIWGTGFMIAPGIFATTCHVIESLRAAAPNDLHLPDGEAVVVDFNYSRRKSGDSVPEFDVTFKGCSEQSGLDVAFLELTSKTGMSLPDPLPLFLGNFEDIKRDLSVLIAYADLDHFIDPDKSDIYGPFVPTSMPYSKFAMIDFFATEDECDEKEGFDVELDTDTTTTGESGGVVIDMHDSDKNNAPVVVGVHTCCSAYFEEDKSTPPLPYHACARLRRTFHNQDISSSSILKDRKLCPILKQYGAVVVDVNGKPQPLSCP